MIDKPYHALLHINVDYEAALTALDIAKSFPADKHSSQSSNHD